MKNDMISVPRIERMRKALLAIFPDGIDNRDQIASTTSAAMLCGFFCVDAIAEIIEEAPCWLYVSHIVTLTNMYLTQVPLLRWTERRRLRDELLAGTMDTSGQQPPGTLKEVIVNELLTGGFVPLNIIIRHPEETQAAGARYALRNDFAQLIMHVLNHYPHLDWKDLVDWQHRHLNTPDTGPLQCEITVSSGSRRFHGRPYAELTKIARSYNAELFLQNCKHPENPQVSANDLMDLMTLRLGERCDVRVVAYGPDAKKAAFAVAACIAKGGE